MFAVNPFSVPVRGGGADGPCSVTSRYKTFYKTYERFYILLVSSLGTVPVDLLFDIHEDSWYRISDRFNDKSGQLDPRVVAHDKCV